MAIINGNAGNNTLNGTPDADTINGLAGNDTITGGLGNDLARMGAGNDTFFWHVGDGSDTLRGQAGFDTLVFECSAILEGLTISRNTTRAILSHSSGATMDLLGIERIYVQALAGIDTITINKLAGTEVTQVLVDLASTPGIGSGGDGEVDTVARNGGSGNDVFNVALVSGNVSITGPAAAVTIRNADADDLLEIAGLGGNDTINASNLPAGIMPLTIDGGSGNDTITGSQGNDLLQGDAGNDVVAGGAGNDFVDAGMGNDTVVGGRGNDTVHLGAGNDLYVWSFGHGEDTVEGGDGIDTLRVTCTNTDDPLSITNGVGTMVAIYEPLFFSSVLFADESERIQIRALGGEDSIAVTDLFGTGVKEVAIDLAASAGGTVADTDADIVSIQDTLIDSSPIEIESSGSNVVVSGLTEEITIAHAGTNDALIVRGSIDSDVIDASGLAAGKMLLRLDVGGGDDTVFGSLGNDTVIGGDGNDVASLGAGNDLFLGGVGNDVVSLGAGNDRVSGYDGNDTVRGGAGNDYVSGGAGSDRALLGDGNDVFFWSPGDGGDTVEGQAGFDTFDISGQADMSLLANVGRVQFSTSGDPASLLNDVERIRVHATDGSDTIHVGNLAGTDIKQLVILDFDGNPILGQDVLDLEPLFDALGVAAGGRAGRVSIVDKGATVDVFVNADGNAGNGFELAVATLHTTNTITVGLGQDVAVGT
jgi:Ca2+-binding RTX toxin-like protein